MPFSFLWIHLIAPPILVIQFWLSIATVHEVKMSFVIIRSVLYIVFSDVCFMVVVVLLTMCFLIVIYLTNDRRQHSA